jgi:hypothetical protein
MLGSEQGLNALRSVCNALAHEGTVKDDALFQHLRATLPLEFVRSLARNFPAVEISDLCERSVQPRPLKLNGTFETKSFSATKLTVIHMDDNVSSPCRQG